MNYYIIPAALIVSVLCSLLFTMLSPRPRPMRGFFILFFIIFLIGWAGQLWITPFGPAIWGISFLPLLFIVIMSLLIMAISSPNPKPNNPTPNPEDASGIAFGMFFWFLIIVLTTSIIAGYYKPPAMP